VICFYYLEQFSLKKFQTAKKKKKKKKLTSIYDFSDVENNALSMTTGLTLIIRPFDQNIFTHISPLAIIIKYIYLCIYLYSMLYYIFYTSL